MKEREYDILTEKNKIKDSYFGHAVTNELFRINTFCLKLLLDMFDGNKTYSMKETHKIIKRVFPNCEFGQRTTISFKDDEELIRRNKNKSSVSCYYLYFKFSDFIKKEEQEISKTNSNYGLL